MEIWRWRRIEIRRIVAAATTRRFAEVAQAITSNRAKRCTLMILFEMPGGDQKEVVEARAACLRETVKNKERGEEVLRWLETVQ